VHSDPHEQKILDNIEKYGWHVVAVMGGPEGPPFAYTIGLMDSYQHPELILLGLQPETIHEIFKTVVEHVKAGRSFVEPVRYEDVIVGYACATRPVHPSQQPGFFGYGLWYRHHVGRTGSLEAIQVFWPDRNGCFPWEDGCDEVAVHLQPLLFEPVDDGSAQPGFSRN
jgi:hypothetical protein